MSEVEYRITFQPTGRSVYVLSGTTIIEAAARAGFILNTPCGGAGTCGKCQVQVVTGAPDAQESDRRFFSPIQLTQGWRLACQTLTTQDMTVNLPLAALLGGEQQIVSTASVAADGALAPATRKVHFVLPEPTLEDSRPDFLRLEEAIGSFHAELGMLRHVPCTLRRRQFSGTAVLIDNALIDVEEGDTTDACYGVAFDIGTTTLVGSLVSLSSGHELATVSRMNPQVSFGDDVLSRIQHAGRCQHCLDELRTVLGDEITRMIHQLCELAQVSSEHLYELVFAGNTTMQHLLCGIDPSPLGTVPFVSAFGHGLRIPTRALGFPVHPHAQAYVFPVIGGFVGGDTVAGLLATGIDASDSPILLIDIGTNGEIVLAHDGQLFATSTAAGPAFEGARITCGMRGTHGAIEKVVMTEDLHLGVIGNATPIGICGSGLIDLIAHLLQQGILSPEGRLLFPDELPPELPAALHARVCVTEDEQVEFVLVDEHMGEHAHAPVVLTQRDVREVQLASGAVRAGITILLQRAGLRVADLTRVLVAGGFGMYIDRANAQGIGLLPTELDAHRIQYVGNVALAGARRALTSYHARAHAEVIARHAQHVELSLDSDFQMQFAEAMLFPEPCPLTASARMS